MDQEWHPVNGATDDYRRCRKDPRVHRARCGAVRRGMFLRFSLEPRLQVATTDVIDRVGSGALDRGDGRVRADRV